MSISTDAPVSPFEAQPFWRPRMLRNALSDMLRPINVAGDNVAPFVDLGLRLWLAQLFVGSSLHEALLTSSTARGIYACLEGVAAIGPELTPLFLAILAAASLALAIGIATRVSALLLLLGLAVTYFGARPEAMDPIWAIMLGWLAIHGGGALALDRLLARGAPTSAVPLAHVTAAAMSLADRLSPAFLLLLRLLFVGILLHVGLAIDLGDSPAELQLALAQLPLPMGPALFTISACLSLGFLTRLAAATAMVGLVYFWAFAAQPSMLSASIFLALLIFARGPGHASLDRFVGLEGRNLDALDSWPHVVIVGAGFAGIAAARRLLGGRVRITLIDKRNHHLFQPLLYQVATAALSPADIATPVRELFRDEPAVTTTMGEIIGISADENRLTLSSGQTLSYDYLVLATGAQPAYFGRDEWSQHAPSLKALEDAVPLRNRILRAFERAEAAGESAAQRRCMTFAIIGGGPTGVELAGAIAELARHGLTGDFRRCDPATAQILLIDRGDRLLKSFKPSASAYAASVLHDLGVEIRLSTGVESVSADELVLSDGVRIPTGVILWAAGVSASAANWIDAPRDASGRIKVGPQLDVSDRSNVFVVGDLAAHASRKGASTPGLAPAAKQQGDFAARVILARATGRRGPHTFRYRHLGDLATIGRSAAIADLGPLRLRGSLAWWIWGLAHVGFLTGVRNRASVALLWLWSYLTYRRPTRLITDV